MIWDKNGIFIYLQTKKYTFSYFCVIERNVFNITSKNNILWWCRSSKYWIYTLTNQVPLYMYMIKDSMLDGNNPVFPLLFAHLHLDGIFATVYIMSATRAELNNQPFLINYATVINTILHYIKYLCVSTHPLS